MNGIVRTLILDRLLTKPRLFGLWKLELGSTFLLIKGGYVHAITTQDGRPDGRFAKRITNDEFEVAPGGMLAAVLEDSPLGQIVVAASEGLLPSMLNHVNLTEYGSSVLGELTWIEPTDSFEFGGYEFNGEPQDLRAVQVAP